MSERPPFTTSMKASSRSSSCGTISRKKKVPKIDLDSRGAISHMESLKGRISPEFQTSPVRKPVNSPNNQLRSSFDFAEVPSAASSRRDMTTVYMTDYCHSTAHEIF